MRQYFTIVKLLFKNSFKLDKTRSSALNIGLLAALGVVYVLIEGLLITGIVYFGGFFVLLGVLNELIAALFLFAAVIVLIYGIVSMLSLLYFSRDTEFFLSLPVKPGTVFAAKFTVVYLRELIICALILLPALIALGIVASVPIAFYPLMLLGVLFAPSVPLILASIIAVPMMYLVSFFKNKGALTSIMVLLLFGGFFVLYMYFMYKSQSFGTEEFDPLAIIEGFQNTLIFMASAVYPFYALARLATLTPAFGLSAVPSAFADFGLSFGVIAVLLLLSVLISGAVYTRGAAAQLEGLKKSSTGKEKHTQSGAFWALVKKEWRMLIRTPAFAFQSLTMLIATPVMLVLTTYATGANTSLPDNLSWFVFTVIMFLNVGLNVAAATAFTREGKSYTISKTLPVSVKTQIRAKKLIYMLISGTTILVGSFIVLGNAPNVLLWFIASAVSFVYAYGFICFAMLFDLRRPKLDWTTPNEAVKMNLNVTLPVFINLAIVIGLGALVFYLVGVISPFNITAVMFSVFAAAAAAVTLVFHFLLNAKAAKLFERMG
ncbi:MAG: hypothetical protein FWH03_07040 [Firmicutes bacterium]|nr:hypothetical protein [Bacillota bacterium]